MSSTITYNIYILSYVTQWLSVDLNRSVSYDAISLTSIRDWNVTKPTDMDSLHMVQSCDASVKWKCAEIASTGPVPSDDAVDIEISRYSLWTLRPREEKLQWIYYVTSDRQQQAVSMIWFLSQFDQTDQPEHWFLSWKEPSWQFVFEPPWMRGGGAKLLANAHKLSKQVAFINSIGASHRHRR